MTTPDTTQRTVHEQVRAGWDRIAEGFDRHVTPLNLGLGDRLVAAAGVGRGTRFLDVAAGSGALAIPAAQRGAQVLATDASPVMLDHLSRRAQQAGLVNVATRVMDAQALELDDGAVDVSASLNGVSLLADLHRGLREMARITRPGGTVLVAAFGPLAQAEFLTFFVGALQAAVPSFTGLPTDPPPLPFQLADPVVLHDRLVAAGLGRVEVQPIIWSLPIRSAAHLWDVVTSSNPLGAQLVAQLDPAQAADARRVLDGMLLERAEGRPPAVLTARLNVGTGTA